jgi:hypothetical protein
VANSGDSIAFNITGTISLASPLSIDRNLTINGSGVIAIDGSGYSGPIFTLSGTAADIFSNLTLENGTVAISGSSNNVSLLNSLVSNNGTGLDRVNATITNSTFQSNATAVNGGTLNLSGVTIANSSTGGLVNADATIVNSTFGNNAAAINGGTVSLYDSTISGGTVGIENSGLTIGNTIVYGNTTDVGSGNSITDRGFNLIGNGTGFFNGQNGDIVGSNPGLGSLANNGGPTPTYALTAGSIAIDAGNNAIIPAGVVTDQRGLSRVSGDGVVDIGAFENQTPEPATYLSCLLGLALGAWRARKTSESRTAITKY